MDGEHLNSDRLAALAVGGAGDPPHLAGCARCRAELEDFRALVAGLRDAPEAPGDLLDAAKRYYRVRRLVESLIERMASEPDLRARAAARPEEVIREAGLEPSPELIEALRESGRSSGDLVRRFAAKTFLV